MAKYVIEDTTLTNTANAIREKTGKTDTITPSNFATEIASIETGGVEPNLQTKSITITENSTQNVTADEGYDGLSDVTITTNVPTGGNVPTKGIIINKFNANGYATDVSVVGMTSIPGYYFASNSTDDLNALNKYVENVRLPNDLTSIENNAFTSCFNLALIELPSGLTSIGNIAFSGCFNLALTELPSGLTSIGNTAFSGCTRLALTSLPNDLTSIGTYAFQNCKNLALTSLPSGITSIGTYTFSGCTNLTKMTCLGNITSIGSNVFNKCTNLTTFVLPNITSVPTLSSSVFSFTPIESGTGYINVPDDLVESFKSATNWSTYADQIKPLNLQTIEIVNLQTINTYNDNKTANIEVTYNGGPTSLYYPEQEGYTLSVSGNATIEGNVLTLTNNAQVGDIITVTVTSTYDSSISSTQEIEVIYKEASISVNINNGQWIDSGTTADNGNIIYKSDAGSYHISNGKSTAVLTVNGYTLVKLYIRSYAESGYDYTEAFAIDRTATRGQGLFTTKTTQSATNYVECIYKLDGGTHTIEIMYSKDSSGDSNDDRGYFYIGEVS